MAANVRIPIAVAALSVRQIRHWDEVERLRPEWNRLLQANRDLGLFATPEWLRPWWYAYGGGKELRVLAIKDEARLVAIIPLYIERARPLLPMAIRRLRFIGDGSGDSDDLDITVQPGYEEAVVDSFLSWARTSNWDVCELNCVSPRSTVLPLLRERITRAEWRYMLGEKAMVTVPLPPTWEQYLKQLSSKERGKVGNRYRHLQNAYKANFYRCERMEELPVALETLFALHQKRWQLKGLPGAFTSADRRLFYYNMATTLLAKDQLELWVLELNGEPAAAQIGLRYGVRVCALQEGFDPGYGSDSVGYVLRSYVLRYCIEHGVREYDFLAGDQDSKQRWGTLAGNYTNLHFAKPGTIGDAHIALAKKARVLKDWLRHHVSEKTFERAQRSRIARRLLGAE